ncbi:hypothetical protein Nizo2776_0558 [Lactiplantibacillus plantarum]|nr:hypothetical protein Nizo2776_0558 [Lactiplantibacillus plantarum]
MTGAHCDLGLLRIKTCWLVGFLFVSTCASYADFRGRVTITGTQPMSI